MRIFEPGLLKCWLHSMVLFDFFHLADQTTDYMVFAHIHVDVQIAIHDRSLGIGPRGISHVGLVVYYTFVVQIGQLVKIELQLRTCKS